jgi:hypothetical protein
VVSSIARLPLEPVIARSGAKSRVPLGRFQSQVSAVDRVFLIVSPQVCFSLDCCSYASGATFVVMVMAQTAYTQNADPAKINGWARCGSTDY